MARKYTHQVKFDGGLCSSHTSEALAVKARDRYLAMSNGKLTESRFEITPAAPPISRNRTGRRAKQTSRAVAASTEVVMDREEELRHALEQLERAVSAYFAKEIGAAAVRPELRDINAQVIRAREVLAQ